MKKFSCLILGALFFTGSAQATLLTFDDVPGGSTSNSYGDMPTYQGYNFSSTLDWIDTGGSTSWPFGAHSGNFTLLNNNGGVGTIAKDDLSDFAFYGLWAKAWASSPESDGAPTLFGTIQGFNNGSLVWSIDTALNGSFRFISGQAPLIDELHLSMGNFYLADDILLSPVPEPETYAMLLAGLGLLGFMVRRRKELAV